MAFPRQGTFGLYHRRKFLKFLRIQFTASYHGLIAKTIAGIIRIIVKITVL
jgi:hypothetical protein